MKKVIIFAASILFSIAAFAENAPFTSEEYMEKSRVYSEIIAGNWNAELYGKSVQMTFTNNHKVQIIETKTNKGLRQYEMGWNINATDNKTVIELTDLIGGNKTGFEIVHFYNNNIVARNEKGQELLMQSANSFGKVSATQLSGHWVSLQYPSDFSKSFVELSLMPNGHYSRAIGNEVAVVEEKGIWSLSATGEYLILQADNSGEQHAIKLNIVQDNKIFITEKVEMPGTGILFETNEPVNMLFNRAQIVD